uniref:Uncharacterized protein n=1 Tax=Anguilla anguilla TaxID=7936 RepID=A0A0E9TM85_ANGAN
MDWWYEERFEQNLKVSYLFRLFV